MSTPRNAKCTAAPDDCGVLGYYDISAGDRFPIKATGVLKIGQLAYNDGTLYFGAADLLAVAVIFGSLLVFAALGWRLGTARWRSARPSLVARHGATLDRLVALAPADPGDDDG